MKLRFDRLGAHRGLRISERIRRIFVQLATPNAKRAIVPGDDADDAEVDVREVRSRGSACTCVFVARNIKLCPDRSIF